MRPVTLFPVLGVLSMGSLFLGGCTQTDDATSETTQEREEARFFLAYGTGVEALDRVGWQGLDSLTLLAHQVCGPTVALGDTLPREGTYSTAFTSRRRLESEPSDTGPHPRGYLLAFAPGACPPGAPPVVDRWVLGVHSTMDPALQEALVETASGLLQAEASILDAVAWRVGNRTVAWSFAGTSYRDAPHRFALVAVSEEDGVLSEETAMAPEGWAGSSGADLVAFVDLLGDDRPELVTVEPLESVRGQSRTLALRVYSRDADGSWSIVREVLLEDQIDV